PAAREALARGSTGGGRRRARRRRAEARGVADLLGVALRHPVDPRLNRLITVLLQELLPDRLLDLRERRRLPGRRGLQRLDDVPAVLRVHGLRDRARLQGEGGLVELRNRLPLLDRQLSALCLRARVGRVLLGEGGEIAAVLDLGVQLVGE